MPALAKPPYEIIAQELAKGARYLDAYEKGGFKRHAASACKFVRRPEIIARVKEIQESRIKTEFDASENAAKSLGIDKRWVLERLRFNAERALRGQPILDENGVQTGKFTGRPDGSTANQALKLIGMELGMFIERHEIGAPGDFSRLTDDELAKRALDDAAALGLPAEATEALMLTFSPSVEAKPETDE
jgi:hypothetical protein